MFEAEQLGDLFARDGSAFGLFEFFPGKNSTGEYPVFSFLLFLVACGLWSRFFNDFQKKILQGDAFRPIGFDGLLDFLDRGLGFAHVQSVK